MKIILAASVIFLSFSGIASAQVQVDGYMRRDGTYVAPHYRSRPDSNPYNNWSTAPNLNPYTGQQGTVTPNTYGSSYGYTPPRSRYGSSYGDR